MLKDAADRIPQQPWGDRPQAQRREDRLSEVVIGELPINPATCVTTSWTRMRGRHWRLEIRAWAKHPDGARTPLHGMGVFLEMRWVPMLAAILNRAAAELEPGPDGLPYRRENTSQLGET